MSLPAVGSEATGRNRIREGFDSVLAVSRGRYGDSRHGAFFSVLEAIDRFRTGSEHETKQGVKLCRRIGSVAQEVSGSRSAHALYLEALLEWYYGDADLVPYHLERALHIAGDPVLVSKCHTAQLTWLQQHGEVERALRHGWLAILAAPGRIPSRFNRALLLHVAGRSSLARRELEQLTRLVSVRQFVIDVPLSAARARIESLRSGFELSGSVIRQMDRDLRGYLYPVEEDRAGLVPRL